MDLARKIINFFTSLKLTVACLALALGLVFIGTLAQVKLGLYIVQETYFQSAFVWWQSEGGLKIPVWPGGYLIGWVLLINLVAAHIKRFELSKKKAGIFITHFGLILLLLGQFTTELFQVESFMAIGEGNSKNFSQSGRLSELAIIDVTDPKEDKVFAVPASLLQKKSEISTPEIPFKLKVQSFSENSHPVLVPNTNLSSQVSHALTFVKTNLAVAMDEVNLPTATIELETDEGVKGPFVVSQWLGEDRPAGAIARQLGSRLESNFYRAPSFTHKGRTYQLYLRATRYYKPFSIQLIDFTHEKYAGTEIPKNFSSRVRVKNAAQNEDREVLIYMNNPLRYGGETYYQGSFEPGDTVSILQVVRNPSWLTPYLACALVGLGLTVQFLMHLFTFAKKRRTA